MGERRRVLEVVKNKGMVNEEREVLAQNVEFAGNGFEKMMGLMFRRRSNYPDALVISNNKLTRNVSIHMLFVFSPVDVLFLNNAHVVTRKASLEPWTGYVSGPAKMVVELPSGGAEEVEVGDEVVFPWRDI